MLIAGNESEIGVTGVFAVLPCEPRFKRDVDLLESSNGNWKRKKHPYESYYML